MKPAGSTFGLSRLRWLFEPVRTSSRAGSNDELTWLGRLFEPADFCGLPVWTRSASGRPRICLPVARFVASRCRTCRYAMRHVPVRDAANGVPARLFRSTGTQKRRPYQVRPPCSMFRNFLFVTRCPGPSWPWPPS